MPENSLAKISDRQLLNELARRMSSRCVTTKPTLNANSQDKEPPKPLRNRALQQMVKSLRAGVHRGQPVEILKFLASNGEKPHSMPQIAAHLKRLRYTATRYYDASNALVVVGLAEKIKIGYDWGWVATSEGRAFLDRTTS